MVKFFVLFLVATLALAGRPADAQTFEQALALYRAGDYEGARTEWLLLAVAGDRDSQYRYGGMYRDGKGVPQNNAIAVEWFLKAALQGQAEAQATLGYMYSQGDGLPRIRDKAKCWYLLAAEQGNAIAQNNLANFLRPGEGRHGGFYWRKRAARQGHTAAMATAGYVLWKSPYERDKTLAYTYIVVAGQRGDMDANAYWTEISASSDRKVQRELAAAEEQAATWEPEYETPPEMPPPVPKACLP